MFEQKEKINLPVELPLGEDPVLDFFGGLRDAAKKHWEDKEEEGQLCVDVAETAGELVIVAVMAGTSPENVELHLHNDLLTIRGSRFSPIPAQAEHACQENYWGKFSRTIVLPVEVRPELCRAEYKNGILIVRFTKNRTDKNIPVFVVEE